LMLDCASCDEYAIRDAEVIRAFVKQLVNDIDMIAYGEPQIVKFGSGDKAGYTLVQLIETSNICAHFVDDDNTMYLDVFSCKEFDQKIVIGLVKKYFDAIQIRPSFITRQA
jgi:S-adenosylmethionine decarboxylase